MKKNLPYLNQERLDIIFDNVYKIVEKNDNVKSFEDEKLSHFLETLKSMQSFNYYHRPDDTRELFSLISDVIHFERNSDGTTLWLALILAIKELYGFSDKKLVTVIEQTTIRK